MSTLEALRAAVTTSDSNIIRSALAAYLKDGSDSLASGEVFKQEPLESYCGNYRQDGKDVGVEASVCSKIITDCVSGKDAGTCSAALSSIVANKSLANGIKNMNGEMARKIVATLGIKLNVQQPVASWLAEMAKTDVGASKSISDNAALMTIITNFVTLAMNPAMNPESIEFSRRRVQLLSAIPARTPRILYESSGKQSGGGSVFTTNTYNQYSDSLRQYISMQNGGNHMHTKVYNEFSNIYNTFVNNLLKQGKKIDDNDDKTIRRTLDELKSLENKLGKVVVYISKYEHVRNNFGLEGELDKNPVTMNLLEELNGKYKELKEKHSVKAGRFLSIADALNLVADNKKLRAEVDELKRIVKPSAPKDPVGSLFESRAAAPSSGLAVTAAPSSGPAAASSSGSMFNPFDTPTALPAPTAGSSKYYSY